MSKGGKATGKGGAMEAVSVEEQRATKVRNMVTERERTRHGTATVERILKAGDGFEKDVGREGVQRISEAPLDRLWYRKAITRHEYDAGDKFRADAYLAAVDPSTGSVDWERAGGGGRSSFVPSMFDAQPIFEARRRYRDLERHFGEFIWTLLTKALIKEHSLETIGREIFGRHTRGEAAVAAVAGLRVALCALSDRYTAGVERAPPQTQALSRTDKIQAAAYAICEADPQSPDPEAKILIGMKPAKAWQPRAEILKAAIEAGLFAWPPKVRLVPVDGGQLA